MGSVTAQPFSVFSRDVRSGLSLASGGPQKDIQRLVPKSLLCCLSALELVFIKDLSVLCTVHLSLDPE